MRRSAIGSITGLLAVVGLSGCGGEERDYAVPDELCSVRVDPGLVEPFLPAGKELKQETSSFGGNKGLEGCTVYVDGHVVLGARGEWRTKGITAHEVATSPGHDLLRDGKYAVWDRGAATVLSCTAPDQEVIESDGGGKGKAAAFSLVVHVPTPDDSTEEAMKKFIGPYAKAYRKTLPCRDG